MSSATESIGLGTGDTDVGLSTYWSAPKIRWANILVEDADHTSVECNSHYNLVVIQARFEVGCQFNIDEVVPMCWSDNGKLVVS